jgi:hypothetical protein
MLANDNKDCFEHDLMGLNHFHRGHTAYIVLYINKECNDQRSQATTSSVSGLKKILKNHTFKQSLLSFVYTALTCKSVSPLVNSLEVIFYRKLLKSFHR